MTMAEVGSADVVVSRSPTALALREELTLDEWLALAPALLGAARSLAWWVGDWLRYGERVYAQQYRAAMDLTGLDLGTLSDYQWVAKHVAPECRREDLSWSHHRAVAALDPERQIAWLNIAADTGLSKQDLMAQIRATGADPDARPEVDAAPARADRHVGVEETVTLRVRLPPTHVSMGRGVMTAAGDQLREKAREMGEGIREHLADAGVSAVVEVR